MAIVKEALFFICRQASPIDLNRFQHRLLDIGMCAPVRAGDAEISGAFIRRRAILAVERMQQRNLQVQRRNGPGLTEGLSAG